eukprot:4214524-Alexandrium_andersonii.AAC.1
MTSLLRYMPNRHAFQATCSPPPFDRSHAPPIAYWTQPPLRQVVPPSALCRLSTRGAGGSVEMVQRGGLYAARAAVRSAWCNFARGADGTCGFAACECAARAC